MHHRAFYCRFALAVILGWLPVKPAEAEVRWGAGLQGSYIATQSNEGQEVDKKGLGVAGTAGASWTFDEGKWLTLGLGLESRQVEGDSASFTQEVKTQGSFLHASYRWNLGVMELGPQLVITRGKAATLRAEDADTDKTVLAFGPELARRWTLDAGDLLAFVAVTQDLNIDHQIKLSLSVGLQFWLKESTQAASEIPETKE
jgi:hypothetical protein